MSELGVNNSESLSSANSKRLKQVLKFTSEALVKKPSVEGLNNLLEIPQDRKLIVATTHFSDADVQAIARVIADYRKIGVVSYSSNLKDFVQAPVFRYAGLENFFEIASKFDYRKRTFKIKFRSEEFEKMRIAMDEGRAMIMTVHKPSYDWKLPDQPGLGVPYLAQISGALVLPVALDIQSQTLVGDTAKSLGKDVKNFLLKRQPSSVVSIGEPIELERIPADDLKLAADMLDFTTRALSLPRERLERGRKTLGIMQEQGKTIMQELAALLPPEKRGSWASSRVD